MRIKRLVSAVGRNGYIHKDLMAIKAGASANGFLYEGDTKSPGFRSIVQSGGIVSVMLVLDDGSVAFGDCVDVIFAGAAGRDPVFIPEEHLSTLHGPVAELLVGVDVSEFRPVVQQISALHERTPLHSAIRYGVTQSLLHATALGHRETIAQTIVREYGSTMETKAVPILVSVSKLDPLQLDRMIVKRADILPHASFTTVDADLGSRGEKLLAYAGSVSKRIREIGAPDYRPRIHLDTYGTLGELFLNDVARIAAYIGKVAETVAPFEFLIESPIIAPTMNDQIRLYRQLRSQLRENGSKVTVIVDEWCNTLEDIRVFGEASACDAVQIKAPDVGSIGDVIESVLYCRQIGMKCCLGGTANETDQSARITANIALACGPEFILGKPGLGGDEAMMILGNEMNRTLALVGVR